MADRGHGVSDYDYSFHRLTHRYETRVSCRSHGCDLWVFRGSLRIDNAQRVSRERDARLDRPKFVVRT